MVVGHEKRSYRRASVWNINAGDAFVPWRIDRFIEWLFAVNSRSSRMKPFNSRMEKAEAVSS